jgi:toxin ParE1/3/4
MNVTYADGVFEELVELSAYIAVENEPAAQRFLDGCETSIRLLAQNPFIGIRKNFENPQLSEVRMWRVKGFEKYLIFYLPSDPGIKILHVMHSAYDYNRIFNIE